MKNPWQDIPANDYEGHMSSVGQLQLLNSTFKHYCDLYQPKNITIPGATTGNGLENVTHETDSITGVDINENYLLQLKTRFPNLTNLHTICGDIQTL